MMSSHDAPSTRWVRNCTEGNTRKINDVVLIDAQNVQIDVCDNPIAHMGTGQPHPAFSVYLTC